MTNSEIPGVDKVNKRLEQLYPNNLQMRETARAGGRAGGYYNFKRPYRTVGPTTPIRKGREKND